MSERSQKIKKSIIVSGLVGSGGFFIAKLIGLFYAIPFSYILGSDAYNSYYGSAYQIYTYLLNIFTAGFPFAIATLVAKYMELGNFKTVLQVKKISLLFMSLTGFLGMAVMMALSGVLAPLLTDSAQGVPIMVTVLCILSIAVFLVPILSAYRGFIQGCKEMQAYAYSQAFEQLFRVGFLLSASCLAVYVLNMERVWALYAAVLSTSIAAIAGIIQIYSASKGLAKDITAEAKHSPLKAIPVNELFREFLLLAVPYMISAVLGYSDSIFNTTLLPMGLKSHGYTTDQFNTIMSAFNYSGLKLNSIPMILAPGFTAAIIPHISAALAVKDTKTIRKNVKECINIVLFIGMFLGFAILIYAKPLIRCLFLTQDLDLSAQVVRWVAIEGFLGTIVPVASSLMMALRLQKSLLKRMFVGTVIKGVLIVPFTWILGFRGTIIATMISYLYIFLLNLREIGKLYKVSFVPTVNIFVKTTAGLVLMFACSWVLTKIGLGNPDSGRIMCFITMCINGLIASAVFVAVEFYFRVPQYLFHFKLNLKKGRP